MRECLRTFKALNALPTRLLLLSVLLATGIATANDDTQFVAGLRERRLFTLAELYCNERLANNAQIAAIDHIELAVELIRTYAEHALNSRGAERDEPWRQAHVIATAFNQRERPRAVLVRVQDALTTLARGELARMESEVSSQSNEALALARVTLRQATSSLKEIDRELTETIPLRRRNALRPNELSAEELMSLQNHVRYQLGRAYKNQALCFPGASSDRTASLTAAIDQLAQPLLQLAPDQPLYVDLRLEQIECLRLLGDVDGAAGYLKTLSNEELSARDQLRVRAERVHWNLARNEAADALKVLGEGRKVAGKTSAELDFASLETYVSLWKAAADKREQDEVSKWRGKSIATAQFIEQEHGMYWARRAEILLIRIGAGSGDGSVDILKRTADDLYRKGKLDDAVAAYDKAASAARTADSMEQSFSLAYKAARVVEQQKRFADASHRFQSLAIRHKTHLYGANSHLLAIANARQASVAAGKWLDSYDKLLREHLANWPGTATASNAACWLGEFEAGRRKWDKAVDAFSFVRPDSEQYADAVKQLGVCWLRYLETLAADAPSRNEELQRAEAFLTQVVRGPEGDLPTEWSLAAHEAVIALSRIHLQYGGEFTDSEALLKASLAASNAEVDARTVAATSLLVGILARQPGRERDARDLLQQVGAASADQLFELFQQITKMTAASSGTAQVDLAKIVIDVAGRLDSQRSNLDASQRLAMDLGIANALALTGDLTAADKLFSRLANDHPNNATVQQSYAQFLLDGHDASYLQRALTQWRRVASRTRPRTPGWFRAKYSVALAQFKLNDKAGAAKLIRYLQATEDLQQSGLEREFDELLTRCTR